MNARFWIHHPDIDKGQVKLTLRPGKSLSFWYGGPTDEGYSSHAEEYELRDGYVYRCAVTDGSDCDGRLTRIDTVRCHITMLRAEWCYIGSAAERADVDFGPPRMPRWEEFDRSQRDYSAEAMGY